MTGASRMLAVLGVALVGAGSLSADDDLLAWWRFDEGEGSRTVDAASQVIDRVRRPVWAPGVRNQALAFDGAGTWVTRAAADAPELPADFTIEAWVAVREYPGAWTPFVNQHQYPQAGFFFGLDQSGMFGLHVSVGGQWRICNSDTPLVKSQWMHVAGVYRADSGLQVYLDGRRAGELAVRGRVPTAESMDLLIGRHNYGSNVFDGIIDEVKMHGRALSTDELAAAHREALPTSPPQFPERPKGARVDSRLEAWWGFEEGEGARIVDAVTGTTDVVHNPVRVAGSTGRGLFCNGSDTWVTRSASEAPALTPDFTIEAWVAVREYPDVWTPIVNQHRAPDAGFFLGLDQSGFFGLHISVGGQWHTCNSDIALPKGRWLHLAAVYRAGSGIRLYINGQLTGQHGVSGRVPTAQDVDLLIGRHNHSPTAFNGIIDEVKLYNTALSAEELVIIGAAGTPPGEPSFPEPDGQP
jgi:hypothetical protein